MEAGEKSSASDTRFSEIGKIEKKEYDKLKLRAIKFEAQNKQCKKILLHKTANQYAGDE